MNTDVTYGSEGGGRYPGKDAIRDRMLVPILLPLGIPVVLAVMALIVALKMQTKLQGLFILGVAYFVLIVAFASVYFSLSWLGDEADASNQYSYYSHLKKNWLHVDKSVPPKRSSDVRAFKGIEPRLWLGIEQTTLRPRHYPPGSSAPIDKIIQSIPDEDSSRRIFEASYNHYASREVFWDCLHYSIVTMATVGYGDISPQSREAKAFTDIQVISAQILFVFALALVLGKK